MNLAPFFKLLGLDPSVPYTAADLRKAWKETVTRHHPDHGGDPQAFINVQHAYEMLTNPEYCLLEERKHQRQNIDSNLTIPISFRDAFFGKDFHITTNVIEVTTSGAPVFKTKHDLEVISFRADPLSIFAEQHLVLDGRGNRCGDTRGQMHIFFKVEASKDYRVEGRDVRSSLAIPLKLYLTGGEVSVETMYGIRDLKVKPGATEVHIPKHGVLHEGSHIVELMPVLPAQDELKQQEWSDLLKIEWSQFQ